PDVLELIDRVPERVGVEHERRRDVGVSARLRARRGGVERGEPELLGERRRRAERPQQQASGGCQPEYAQASADHHHALLFFFFLHFFLPLHFFFFFFCALEVVSLGWLPGP